MAHVQSYNSSVFASHEAAESVEERREEDVDSSELPRERPRQATVPDWAAAHLGDRTIPWASSTRSRRVSTPSNRPCSVTHLREGFRGQ